MNTSTPTRARATAASPLAASLWAGMADRAARFLADTGTLPGPGPDVAQDELAGWLAVQRRSAQQGRLSAERRAYLDADVPGWRQTRQERWEAQLAAAESDRSGRAGRAWLKTQRRCAAAGTLSDERRAVLDTRVRGWDRPAADTQALWLNRAEDLANLVDFAGRLPASKGGDANAVYLYRWMCYQRTLARAGKLSRARRKWLDKNVPGWIPAADWRDTSWAGRAAELKEFVATAGRFPRVSERTENALARWLGTQRASARGGRLAAARRKQLDAIAADWLRIREGE